MKQITQVEPWIDNSELQEISRVIDSTYVTESKLTQEFEFLTANYTQSKYAVSICNGTCAIFCALKALGVGNGDEVIVPNITFVSTATSVLLAGAKVKLIDIDPETLCINHKLLRNSIGEDTKAIIPVHLYGRSCEMLEIKQIAKEYNLHLIEDSAQGMGVKYMDRHVGTFGDIGVLSYHGNKTITTGEGGIILCNSSNVRDRIYQLKNHGRIKKGTFIHESIGWNFSFTEMQAAVGISQMKKLKEIIDKKNKIYDSYLKGIKNSKLSMQSVPKSTTDPVHWFSNICCNDANLLSEYLKDNDIPSRKLFYPLHLQPCFKKHTKVLNLEDSYEASCLAYNQTLSLPSSVLMSRDQLDYVIQALNKY